jgi:para-aminobenzoate synthetase component I
MGHRVLTARLDHWVDPARAYAAVCGDSAEAFWLDSGVHAGGGMSYLGTADSLVAEVHGSEFGGPVLEWMAAELDRDIDTSDAPPGFTLGLVGWLGYELRAETMGTPETRRSRYPRAAWLRVHRALAFDHAARQVWLLALGDDAGWTGAVGAWRASTEAMLRETTEPAEPFVPKRTTATWAYDDDEYLGMIRACQAAIVEGEAYQLCLTTEATVHVAPDPVATYLALRTLSPTHHGALLRAGGVSLLSASPEQFLSVSPDRVVESKPIKGTRPRGDSPEADERLRAELLGSDKERAENLMIVDLMRNDIGRVCEVGTVTVTSLLEVESYAQVHQLVSTVRGILAKQLRPVDAVAACFPAGSMTGAPKHRATLILDALEHRPRGIYSGAFGYLGFDGTVDLAMVIRSIVIDHESATVGAGGGITALSVPEEELAEAKLKAAALLSVLGAG